MQSRAYHHLMILILRGHWTRFKYLKEYMVFFKMNKFHSDKLSVAAFLSLKKGVALTCV